MVEVSANTGTTPPKIVIIGNSGSGKSTLAKEFGRRLKSDVVDLDPIHWQGQVGLQRDEAEAKRLVADAAAKPGWIIEGVFGWLAEVALPRATSLVWLDLSREVCRDGLAMRGPWKSGTPEQYADFLQWADDYWTRTTPSSYAGHLALFESFAGVKWRLRSRIEIATFLSSDGV